MQPFINVPYEMVEKNIPRIASLRIGIEIYFDNNLLEEVSNGKTKTLKQRLDEDNIPRTVHAPFMDLSPGAYDRKVRAISGDVLKRSAELASLLGAKGLVCHPGYDKWRFADKEQFWLEESVKTWTEVIGAADTKVPVMIENVFEEEPDTLISLLGLFRGKNLWFCFDSGHFNLFAKRPLDAWLMPLKENIREMHLHDNHGSADDHLPLGRGTFPFRDLKPFLTVPRQEVVYVAEVHSESLAMESLKNLKEFLS
jgi:sugar phosphate isomerase/epimerase